MTDVTPSATGYEGLPNGNIKMVIYTIAASVATSDTFDVNDSTNITNPLERIKTVRHAQASLTTSGTAVPVTWSGSEITFGTIGSDGNVSLVVFGSD